MRENIKALAKLIHAVNDPMTQEQELQQIIEIIKEADKQAELPNWVTDEGAAIIAKAIIDSRALRTGGVKPLEWVAVNEFHWRARTALGWYDIFQYGGSFVIEANLSVASEATIPTQQSLEAAQDNCQTHFNSLIGSCLTDEPGIRELFWRGNQSLFYETEQDENGEWLLWLNGEVFIGKYKSEELAKAGAQTDSNRRNQLNTSHH